MAVQEKPTRTLLADLVDGVSRLVRQEVQLAQVESSEKVGEIIKGVAAIGTGLLVAAIALIVLIEAVVAALANFMPPAIAALVVGVALALIALLLVFSGQKALSASNLALPRTREALQDDKELVMERTR